MAGTAAKIIISERQQKVVAYLRCTAGNDSHSDNDHT